MFGYLKFIVTRSSNPKPLRVDVLHGPARWNVVHTNHHPMSKVDRGPLAESLSEESAAFGFPTISDRSGA